MSNIFKPPDKMVSRSDYKLDGNIMGCLQKYIDFLMQLVTLYQY